jgi:hypothetical protein
VRLLPPTDDHPASMLRWVRGVELFNIPLGLVMALLLHEQGLGAWWIGLVVAALGLIGFATIGPATRRAEEHGPNDPATRPARLRRARRLTMGIYGGASVVAVVVIALVDSVTVGVVIGVVITTIFGAAFWLVGRWAEQ